MPVQDIRADDLRKLIKENPGKLEIIDVREPDEYEIIHIKGSKLIPMGELMEKIGEIDWNKEVVFICRSGSRSKMMASLLGAQGKDIKNLRYGIYECQADGKGEFLEAIPDAVEGYF